MRRDLSEASRSYREDAAVYDRFSACEDADGLVLDHLLPLARGKRVLDVGCGTGKYAAALAPVADAIDGVDAAAGQLDIARARCAGHANVRFHAADAAAGLPKGPYDLVLAAWVLGTILDEDRRARALANMRASLAPGGRIVLVENAEGGAFEAVRGRVNDPDRRTAAYNGWLRRAGFAPTLSAATRFGFTSLDEARAVFAAIWGPAAAARVGAPDLEHRIIVFERGAG